VEVRVDGVRVGQGSSVVQLKVLESAGLVVSVHIGEAESAALLKEMARTRQPRPLTHDLCKSLMQAVGYRVTRLRITEIHNNTFFARIHVARADGAAGGGGGEVDIDCRPSDGINLAVRFGAPMYVSRRIAQTAAPPEPPAGAEAAFYGGGGGAAGHAGGESQAEVMRTCRDALASFDDPTILLTLQKELAVKEERYGEAQARARAYCCYCSVCARLRVGAPG